MFITSIIHVNLNYYEKKKQTKNKTKHILNNSC